MSAGVVLPLLSSVVSALFILALLDQYVRRHRTYQLVWMLGLLWYGISTWTQYYGAAFGWSPFTYQLWYLAGAYLVAAYLGMGTLYLLAPRGVAHTVMLVLAVSSMAAAVLVFTTPVDVARLPAPGDHPTAAAFPSFPGSPVRILTPLFNLFGTVLLVGGALQSAWTFYRRGSYPHRVVSNLLIAGGALVVAGASALTRFGVPEGLAVGQFAGLMLIFSGFVISTETFEQVRIPFTGVLLARRARL